MLNLIPFPSPSPPTLVRHHYEALVRPRTTHRCSFVNQRYSDHYILECTRAALSEALSGPTPELEWALAEQPSPVPPPTALKTEFDHAVALERALVPTGTALTRLGIPTSNQYPVALTPGAIDDAADLATKLLTKAAVTSDAGLRALADKITAALVSLVRHLQAREALRDSGELGILNIDMLNLFSGLSDARLQGPADATAWPYLDRDPGEYSLGGVSAIKVAHRQLKVVDLVCTTSRVLKDYEHVVYLAALASRASGANAGSQRPLLYLRDVKSEDLSSVPEWLSLAASPLIGVSMLAACRLEHALIRIKRKTGVVRAALKQIDEGQKDA